MTESRTRFSVLWGFARPHRRSLGIALVLGLFASSMELASPMVTKWVLDTLAEGGSLLAPALTLVALLVVGTAVGYRQWLLLGTLAEDIVRDARRHLVSRYLAAKVLPLLRRPSGDLVTRVTSDSVLLREAASSSLVGIINGLVMLVGTLVLMAVLDLVLLGATVLAIGVVTVLFLTLMPGIATAQERAQAALADVGAGTDGSVRAIKTIKAAGAEDRLRDRLFDDVDTARGHGVAAMRREVLAWTISWAGVQAAIIAILIVGAARVASGDMPVSTLVAFLLYAFGLMGPIMDLSQNTTALQAGIAAAGRIREIDDLPLERTDGLPTGDRVDARDLRLDGVTATYSGATRPALRGIDLALPRTGHVALVGPSGAGKTSILSVLVGFLEPEAGRVSRDGRAYPQLSARQVRAGLAYVEQETPVVPGTIRDNLTIASPDVSEDRIRAVLAELRLDELVAGLPDGLATAISDTSVSGGQRQRIAVARALLADPEVLLLDEATAQVDGLTEVAIGRAIERQAAQGLVITIAHRLSTVVGADEILLVDGGRIVARGTHAQLLESSELYGDLVAALSLESAGVRTDAPQSR